MSRNRTPIGVDLGSRTIKAVQLVRKRGAWHLHAGIVLTLPVPDHPLDEHMARYLREMMFRHGFIGEEVVLAAPTKQLAVDILELPPRSSGAPVEQIARMEMARTAKLESEPFELGCWDLPTAARAGASTSVMAVALRQTDANALLDPFDAVGLHVVAIDARCCALARACHSCAAQDEMSAVLDLGWNSALITLVRDGTVVYQRTLTEWGLSAVFRAVAEEFELAEDETDYVLKQIGVAAAINQDLSGLPQARRVQQLLIRLAERIVTEIDAALHYASHRYPDTPVQHLLLVGGGSSIAGICELLSQQTKLVTRILSPGTIVHCPDDRSARGSDGVLTTALGLAWNEGAN